MKRIFSLILAFIFTLPLLFLSVAAAEKEEYVFERFEVPVMYTDYPFTESSSMFVYEGYLPEGLYLITPLLFDEFIDSGSEIYCPGVVSIKYSYTEGAVFSYVCKFNSTVVGFDPFSGKFSETVEFAIGYDEFEGVPTTVLSVYGSDGVFMDISSFVKNIVLVSYDFGNSLLGDLLQNPNDLFAPILNLIPLVIPVFVSYLAVRKAISFVRSKLSGA